MKLSEEQAKVIRDYFRDKPVLKAYVFGSYSRDEATEDSDIDLMIELKNDHSLGLEFFGFGPALSARLGQRVNLTTINGFSPHVIENVMRDKRLIYERKGA